MLDKTKLKKLTFGVCADVHKDIMHDTDARLGAFIDEMNRQQVDFIIQMGDFCFPAEYNRSFLSIWEKFKGPRYHVIGNHDAQGHHTRQEVMDFWKMPRRYYSFDMHGYHFVVLDANDVRKDPPPSNPDFPSCIGPDQFEWLRNDLLATEAPSFLFSHQTLEKEEGVDGRDEVQALLKEINKKAGWQKVVASFCGDLHVDYCERVNGIHNIIINSMSNYWMGEDYQRIRYNELIDSHFPWINCTAPYKDPLYATVTLEPDGRMVVTGIESEFVGPSPQELNFPVETKKGSIVPKISSRVLKMWNLDSWNTGHLLLAGWD